MKTQIYQFAIENSHDEFIDIEVHHLDGYIDISTDGGSNSFAIDSKEELQSLFESLMRYFPETDE